MDETGSRLERLRAALALVEPGARVADIGSGGGWLPRALLASGRARWALATERSAERLRELRPLAARPALRGRLALRHGDGLAPIVAEDRVDTVTITGLGARSMCRILAAAPARLPGLARLVLQPQTEWGFLRRWLVSHGFAIVAERLVEAAGRHYLVLAAEPSEAAHPEPHAGLGGEELLEAGPWLVRAAGPEVRRHFEAQLARNARLVAAAGPGAAPRADRDARLARRVLAALDARGSALGSDSC